MKAKGGQEKAERQPTWNEQVGQALVELAGAVTGEDDSLEVIADVVLDLSRKLTRSRYGVVSSTDPETGENLALVSCLAEDGLGLPVMLPDSIGRVRFESEATGIDGGPSLKDLLAVTSRSGTAGSEKGVRTRRFLAVSARAGEAQLGQIALWGPDHDYTQSELDAVFRIGRMYVLVLHRWRIKQQVLKNEHRLEVLVSERTVELVAANRNLESEVAERRRAEQTLRDLSARLMTAQEEERSWLARELHDDLNQKLALLAVELEQLGLKPPGTPAELRRRTLELCKSTQGISSDLHNLSQQLHPSQFKLLGLVPALRRFCTEFGRQHGLTVELSVGGEVTQTLPEDLALGLYRVVQEALHNVAAHSRAEEARVELSATADGLQLSVSDLGVGFDQREAAERPGLGLVSMRERMHLMGGTLQVESAPSKGTRLLARVPVPRSDPPGGPAPDGSDPGQSERDETASSEEKGVGDAPSCSTRR